MPTARPLSKTGLGDFRQYDPIIEALRRSAEYYFPGDAPANHRGRNVTTMQKGAEAPLPQPTPTRIDLARLMAEQQPPQGQPPQMMAQPTDSLQAQVVTPGEDAGMPMPAPSPNRMGLPSRGGPVMGVPPRNPMFSGDIENAEAAPDNEAIEGGAPMPGQRPGLQEMAMLLAGSKQRPPFTQPDRWAAMSPADLRNAPWMT